MYARHFARRANLLLAFILLASTLLAACDSTPTPAPTQPLDPTATTQAVSQADTPTTEILATQSVPTQDTQDTPTPGVTGPTEPPIDTPTPEPPAAPSSLDKITAAEQAGIIDHDTALVYQLFSYFDRASLPAEYIGDDSNTIVEGGDILTELSERLDTLPADLRAKVEPFLFRPDDPASFWNRPPADTATAGGFNAPKATPSPTMPAGWTPVDSSNTRTRVWYPQVESGDGFAKMAEDLAKEIDSSRMWAREKLVMFGKYEPCSDAAMLPNGGDDRLDIYLVFPGTKPPRGNDSPAFSPEWNGLFFAPRIYLDRDCAAAGYILLNNAQDFKHLKNSMAHELFHAFQAAVTPNTRFPEWKWWSESTASWAMDLIYPTDNIEHEFLMKDPNSWTYQRRFSGPLTCTGRETLCIYAAYMWPFYLTRGGGGATDEFIGRVWEQSKDKQPITAMADMNGWADQWKQFALWNWNEGPADFYRDPSEQGGEGHIAPMKQMAIDMTGKGRFEAPPLPWTMRGWGWPLDLAKTYSADVNLPPATFDYYVAGKPDDKSGILRFEFGDLSRFDGGAVQAIVTIGPPDKPLIRFTEDWSGLSERKFCLDRPDEYATNVVVVVSNSNLRPGDRLQGKLKVTSEAGTCPNSSNLTYTVGGNYSLHDDGKDDANFASGSFSTYQQVQSTWKLQFDRREGDDIFYNFVSTNQIDMHANANLSGEVRDFEGVIGMVGSVSASINGSGITHNPTTPEDATYGKKTLATLGNQYNNLPDPEQPGTLRLTKMNGKDAYIMTLGMTQIVPNYTYHTMLRSGCRPHSTYTHEEDYDNQAFTLTHTESGDSYCYRYTDNKTEVSEGPFAFGTIQLAHNMPRGPVGSYNFIAGYYDPKSNLLEGGEAYSTKVCREAFMVDPLAYFVNTTDSQLRTLHNSFSTPEAATCNLFYTSHWRIELPKQ